MDLAKKIAPIVTKKGEFILSSGRKSNLKFDVNFLAGNPELRNELIDELYNKINATVKDFDLIVGCGHGGDPLVSLIGSRHLKKVAVIKDYSKDGNRIEGCQPKKGDRVVIVDDVVTSGGTLLQARKFMEEKETSVVAYIVVINRECYQGPSFDNEKPEIPLGYLFSERDLL